VRKLLHSIDARVPIYQVATLSEEIHQSLWRERLLAGIASCFGLIAMLLSAIGIFGILACFVARRQREIGIRMALGAQPSRVILLIVARVIRPLSIGVLAGGALSAIASHWVRDLLYGVQPFDPLSAGLALALIVALGVAGAMAPALRSVRIDPASALREE
jgi:ABC-type antimicrobial peptide transport system permease subunit